MRRARHDVAAVRIDFPQQHVARTVVPGHLRNINADAAGRVGGKCGVPRFGGIAYQGVGETSGDFNPKLFGVIKDI